MWLVGVASVLELAFKQKVGAYDEFSLSCHLQAESGTVKSYIAGSRIKLLPEV